jgi:hypothetical protein
MAALRFLKGEIGEAAIDTLPDIFWLRLADCIERRGGEIVYYVRSLLNYRDPLDLKGPYVASRSRSCFSCHAVANDP